MSLFDGAFLLIAIAVSFLIMFGFKEYVPRVLRVGAQVLLLLALLPIIFCWVANAFHVVGSELDHVPLPLVILAVVGHVVLGVAYLRHRFQKNARPDPRAAERDRVRARERTRLPPRGED